MCVPLNHNSVSSSADGHEEMLPLRPPCVTQSADVRLMSPFT